MLESSATAEGEAANQTTTTGEGGDGISGSVVQAQTEQPVLTEPAGAVEATSGFMSPRSCNDQS